LPRQGSPAPGGHPGASTSEAIEGHRCGAVPRVGRPTAPRATSGATRSWPCARFVTRTRWRVGLASPGRLPSKLDQLARGSDHTRPEVDAGATMCSVPSSGHSAPTRRGQESTGTVAAAISRQGPPRRPRLGRRGGEIEKAAWSTVSTSRPPRGASGGCGSPRSGLGPQGRQGNGSSDHFAHVPPPPGGLGGYEIRAGKPGGPRLRRPLNQGRRWGWPN